MREAKLKIFILIKNAYTLKKSESLLKEWIFLLLFTLLLFIKERRERIALGALYLKSEIAKEQKANERFTLFKRDSLFLGVGGEEKCLNSFFSPCFSSFYAKNKKANLSRRSIKKRDESDSLLSFF